MYKAKVEEGKIIVEDEPEEVFQLGGFGKLKNGKLHLKAYEALHLVGREKIKVMDGNGEMSEREIYELGCEEEDNFPQKYLVYEDLRRSGYRVRPGYSFPGDLRVYERGTSFSDDESKMKHVKWLMDVVGTDSDFSLSKRSEKMRDIKNIRAYHAMSIVDEEGDVTYYQLNKESKLDTAEEIEMELEEPVEGEVKGNFVLVWDDEDIERIYQPHYFGKKRKNRLELNFMEATYLQEKGMLEIRDSGESLNENDFREIVEENVLEFEDKYQTYKDLRDKGFLVRAGFKFGTHFRVYDKGVELKKGQKSPDEHTKWVVHAVPEDFTWSYPELSRFVRLALNIRSKPTLASLNDDIKYYRMVRITP